MNSNKKINHKIIVLTGAIASGKTTVRTEICSLLDKVSLPYHLISGINDLYIPFAIKNKIITEKKEYSRIETNNLMKTLYSKYGESLGSNLLIEFLKNKPDNIFYIIDSKRNPEGISFLKNECKNVLVIGVFSNKKERLSRYHLRKRLFDFKNNEIIDPEISFKADEDIFKISDSVANSDLIIENNGKLLKSVLASNLFDVLIKKNFLPEVVTQSDKKISFPEYKNYSSKEILATADDLKTGINKIYTKSKNDSVVVIQGGNRYMAEYLKSLGHSRVFSLKVLCLTKVTLCNMLNTVLTPKERVEKIDETNAKGIINFFGLLEKKYQIKLTKNINKAGFKDLNDLLIYGSRSEVLKVFFDYMVPTPFSYPADDRKIVREFRQVNDFLTGKKSKILFLEIAPFILKNTTFYNFLHKGDHKIYFIDDLLYRGRTFFTLSVMCRFLNVPENRWTLNTLFRNKKIGQAPHERIWVWNEEKGYPFENSITTEKGYWEENGFTFNFNDLIKYWRFLIYFAKAKFDWSETEIKFYNMNSLIGRLSRNLKTNIIDEQTKRYLFLMFISCKVDKLIFDEKALIDQRSSRLGFSAPFVGIISSFINQASNRPQRQKYKDDILLFIKQLRQLEKSKNKKGDFKKIISLYKEVGLFSEYKLIKEFFNTLEDKNEWEVKYLLDSEKKINNFIDKLKNKNYIYLGTQTETDYIPDTENYDCRKNGIILRFRSVSFFNTNDILLTLKINNKVGINEKYSEEHQFYFSDFDKSVFDRINKILKQKTKLSLPTGIFKKNSLNDIENEMVKIGFTKTRIYLQKNRSNYIKINEYALVTIDELAEKIGIYTELEARSLEDLNKMKKDLSLNNWQPESKDYGDILKEKKNNYPEDQRRRAVFYN